MQSMNYIGLDVRKQSATACRTAVDICTDPVRATSLGFPLFCVISSQVDWSRNIIGLGYAKQERASKVRFETVVESWYEIILLDLCFSQ
jgi:hypothetical protein